MLRVLWAHLKHGGSHQNDFGLRKSPTSPSGALLRKTFVFVGAVARSLHMTQTDMKSIVYIFVIIHIHDSRSKSLMMSCITEFHVCYIEFTQFAMVWNSNGRVVPTRSTNVGSADIGYYTMIYVMIS